MTFALQCTIETSVKLGIDRCGFLSDVEKCFNMIPRKPLMLLAKKLGLPNTILTAWIAFLGSMLRSFLAQSSPSEPLWSNNGLPEGDSVSCVGMLLLDMCFHFYMQRFQPRLCELSDVDNLELVGDSPDAICAGALTLETWAEMFSLSLDSKKSFFWALNVVDRRALVLL